MSIAIKKFLSMLDQELLSDDKLSENQKKVLKKFCEKVYVLETTNDGSAQLPSQIREEVKFYADDSEK